MGATKYGKKVWRIYLYFWLASALKPEEQVILILTLEQLVLIQIKADLLVLGKLVPGQLGPGQLSPGAQLSAPKKWTVGPRTVLPLEIYHISTKYHQIQNTASKMQT